MIITGFILVSIGLSALLHLNIWPVVLVGLGAGMVLSGVMGRFGWEPLVNFGRRRSKKVPRRHGSAPVGDELT